MNSSFTAIIIDDETLGIKRLRRLLENHKESIEILAEANNAYEGLQLIEHHKPDLIFLDIEMPGMNGFEMLKKLSFLPKIIFTTAYDEYAIKAFEENSIDYLLKPIEVERLDKSIEKLKRMSVSDLTPLPLQLDKFMSDLKTKKEVKSIPVKIGDKILLIKTDQISYLKAKDKYVFVVTDENKEYLTDFTLSSLEEKLPAPFLRVHRAYMINCDKIKEIHKGFNGSFTLVMKDKNSTKVQTGRSYNESVKGIFEL